MDNIRNEVWPLFSKPVYLTDVLMSDDETKTLLNHYNNSEFHIAREKDDHAYSCDITTNRQVLTELPWLEQKITDRFKQFSDEIMHYENDFKIINSWYTRTFKGQETTYHQHANFMWTGSLYFGNDETYEQKISWRNYNTSGFYVPIKEANIYNTDEWNFKIRNNMVVFFPSEMYHTIVKNNHDTERKSLAFNMLPVGDIINGEATIKFI